MKIKRLFTLFMVACLSATTLWAQESDCTEDATDGACSFAVELMSNLTTCDGSSSLAAYGFTKSGVVVASDSESAFVTMTGSSYRGDSHSTVNKPVFEFSTQYAFTVTLGGCQYDNADAISVYIDGEVVATLDGKTSGCYHSSTSNVVTYSYNKIGDTPRTVKISGAQYVPYFALTIEEAIIKEKCLYSTDFSDWCDYETSAATSVTTATWTTKYSNETLSFYVYDSQIGCTNFNTSKFPSWEGGFIMAAESADPYITTSALSSITRVEFEHGATGSSRGWMLEAKGDGDDDWVTISNSVALTAAGTEVAVDVNRTNCQLRFTNLNSAQNAYLMYLNIYGNVDYSTIPQLGTFVFNGETYEAGDVFDGDNVGTLELSKTFTITSELAASLLTDLVPDNGEVGEVTTTVSEDNTSITYTFPVTLTSGSEEVVVNYTLYVVQKPDYTLTYIDTDGVTVIGTRTIEQDAAITEFDYTSANATVADGYAFRGWFVSASGANNRKYTESEIITEDTDLYGIATEIETATGSASYTYDLTNQYFYAEDHECFNPTGGYYYNSHGWTFSAGETIEVPVAGDAYLVFTLCAYGNDGTITVTDANGNEVGSIANKASSDGGTDVIEYTGEATTLTITFSASSYLHKLMVTNVSETSIEVNDAGYYVVEAGNAGHFLTTLTVACAASSADNRVKIFLPDGTYDLGETVLTNVSGQNVSIIGQSMENTVIVNAPDISVEGIGTTATLYNTSSNLYMQDLTLRNDLDYYNSGSAGRAVCLQDKGTQTICKNVKMMSYQDTYYSNKATQFYWETSELQGTVDFLCVDGDIVYHQCDTVVRPRTADGSGACTIAAPYQTSGTCDWGYVFLNCNIINEAASFNFGRAWGGAARLAYINTVFTGTSEYEIASTRFTVAGMNVAATGFYEYNSVNEAGEVVSPSSNQITFTHSSGNNTLETILTADQAAVYTVSNIYSAAGWTPDVDAAQVEMGALTVGEDSLTISWIAVAEIAIYAVFV